MNDAQYEFYHWWFETISIFVVLFVLQWPYPFVSGLVFVVLFNTLLKE